MPYIDKIPDEILVLIFKSHVCGNSNSPHPLLRVCRRWYAISTDIAELWRDIVFTNATKELVSSLAGLVLNKSLTIDAWERLKDKIVCTSLRSVATAIQRTKSLPFSLSLFFPFSIPEVKDPNWGIIESPSQDWIKASISQRCHQITIVDVRFFDRFKFGDFASLQHLIVQAEPSIQRRFMINFIQWTSTNLRRVDVESDSNAETLISDHPELITNLEMFLVNTFQYIGNEISLHAAPKLTELTLRCKLNGFQTVILDASMPALRSLGITNMWLNQVNRTTVSNLKHLTIEVATSIAITGHYELPNLLDLCLLGSWSPASHLQAPNLVSLKLHAGRNAGDQAYEVLRDATLRPKKLEIEVGNRSGLEEAQLAALLSKQWEDTEILRIIFTGPKSWFGETIAAAIFGTKSHLAACSRLEKLEALLLTQLSPNTDDFIHRDQVLGRLRALADTRRVDGALTSIKFGWHNAQIGVEIDDGAIDWSVIVSREI